MKPFPTFTVRVQKDNGRVEFYPAETATDALQTAREHRAADDTIRVDIRKDK